MIRPFLMCFVLCVVYGDTKPMETKSRVHEEKPLSNLEHDDEKSHDYDHDAFLGKEQAKTFDKLPPEESKRRLGIIIDKIDANKDGFIKEEEMTVWIRNIQLKEIHGGVEHQFKDLDENRDEVISWEEYKTITFSSYLDDPDSHSDGQFNFTEMVVKDEKRFRAADRNRDLKMDKEEMGAFLYPEEFEYMHDILAQETIDEIDKNGDGFIDMKEYIGDFYTPDDGESEPDWVEAERVDFREKRDKNKDGKLDKEEVLAWIIPDDIPLAESEAKHLLEQSDSNNDAKLSKQEILEKYQVFVGSQLTEYGDALLRHDEF